MMVSWVFDHILDLYSRVHKERFCIAGDEPCLEGCGIRGKGGHCEWSVVDVAIPEKVIDQDDGSLFLLRSAPSEIPLEH